MTHAQRNAFRRRGVSPNSGRLCKYYAGYGFRQIFTRAREAQPGNHYILCRIYLNCHTS
jgi:hypothetical protein